MLSNKKSPFLLVLTTILLFSSCITNNKSLGSDFISEDYYLKVQVESIPIKVTSQLPDSVQASSTSTLINGYISDPIFGTTKVGSVVKVSPINDTINFGTNPEYIKAEMTFSVDSTKLVLKEDEGLAQNIYIYKLKRDIDTLRLYNYSYKPEDFETELIGVGSPVYFGSKNMKISIRESFGKELLATSKEELEDFDKFQKRVKGLYISTDSPETIRKGGRLNYIGVSSCFITLNYKLTDSEKGLLKRDTTTTFVVGRDFSINISTTGSAHLASDNPTDHLYVDAFAGVKPHISGVELKKTLLDWAKSKSIDPQRILFSRASIVFPYKTPDEQIELSLYSKSIFACTVYAHPDSVKSLIPIPEVYSVQNPGLRNGSFEEYTCDITNHLQKLITMDDEKIVTGDQDLWFSPLISYADQYNNVYHRFDMTGYNRTILNGPTADKKPYLKFTYVVMNK